MKHANSFYLEQSIQIGLEHKNVKSYIRLEQELKYYISEIKQECQAK